MLLCVVVLLGRGYLIWRCFPWQRTELIVGRIYFGKLFSAPMSFKGCIVLERDIDRQRYRETNREINRQIGRFLTELYPVYKMFENSFLCFLTRICNTFLSTLTVLYETVSRRPFVIHLWINTRRTIVATTSFLEHIFAIAGTVGKSKNRTAKTYVMAFVAV